MNLFESAQQMPLELKCKESIFSFKMNQDWFAEDFEHGKFKYKKIKAQCWIDQTFYCGHFKPLDVKSATSENL